MQTNRTLLQFNDECQRMQGTIIGEFFRPKIRQFYNDNNIRLDTLFKKMTALKEEHFEIEGEGDYKRVKTYTPEPIDGVAQQPKPVMKTDKTEDDYTKAFNELMDGEVNIKI